MDLETLRGIAELMEEHGLTRPNARGATPSSTSPARWPPRPPWPWRRRSPVGRPAGTPSMTLAPTAASAAAPAPAPEPTAVPEAAPAPCGLSTADGQPVDSARVSEVCAPMVVRVLRRPRPGRRALRSRGRPREEGRHPAHPRGHEAHERGRGRARRRGRGGLRGGWGAGRVRPRSFQDLRGSWWIVARRVPRGLTYLMYASAPRALRATIRL